MKHGNGGVLEKWDEQLELFLHCCTQVTHASAHYIFYGTMLYAIDVKARKAQ